MKESNVPVVVGRSDQERAGGSCVFLVSVGLPAATTRVFFGMRSLKMCCLRTVPNGRKGKANEQRRNLATGRRFLTASTPNCRCRGCSKMSFLLIFEFLARSLALSWCARRLQHTLSRGCEKTRFLDILDN